MTFQARLDEGKKFELEVEQYLLSHGNVIGVAKNGTEHTHPKFVELLRDNKSEPSKFVRFAPDGVVIDRHKHVYHWEAKSSINMEKDAYETYMKYAESGCNVLVFVKHEKCIYQQFIEKLKFTSSQIVVNRFINQYPVDSDGWICPRKAKNKRGHGSGTPYKEIDLISMAKIDNWNIDQLTTND